MTLNAEQLGQRPTVLSFVGELGIPIIDAEQALIEQPDPESLFEPITEFVTRTVDPAGACTTARKDTESSRRRSPHTWPRADHETT